MMWSRAKTTFGLIVAALLLAFAAAKASKRGDRAEKREETSKELQYGGKIKSAERLAKAANKDKVVARKAKANIEKQLEKLSEANQDIDAIADRFNSKRVRYKPKTAS